MLSVSWTDKEMEIKRLMVGECVCMRVLKYVCQMSLCTYVCIDTVIYDQPVSNPHFVYAYKQSHTFYQGIAFVYWIKNRICKLHRHQSISILPIKSCETNMMRTNSKHKQEHELEAWTEIIKNNGNRFVFQAIQMCI